MNFRRRCCIDSTNSSSDEVARIVLSASTLHLTLSFAEFDALLRGCWHRFHSSGIVLGRVTCRHTSVSADMGHPQSYLLFPSSREIKVTVSHSIMVTSSHGHCETSETSDKLPQSLFRYLQCLFAPCVRRVFTNSDPYRYPLTRCYIVANCVMDSSRVGISGAIFQCFSSRKTPDRSVSIAPRIVAEWSSALLKHASRFSSSRCVLSVFHIDLERPRKWN